MASVFVLLLMMNCCSNKEGFIINGTVMSGDYDGGWAFLLTQIDSIHGQEVDSVQIENGNFSFSGEEERLRLIIVKDQNKKNITEFLLVITESGVISVEMNRPASAKGTPQNEKLQQWKESKQRLESFARNYATKGIRYSSQSDSVKAYETKDSLRLAFQALSYKLLLNNKTNTLGDFLRKNALYILNEQQREKILSLYAE